MAALEDREPVDLRCSVVFFRNDAVLLCRRTDESRTWVLPGGTPHRGEGSAAAARREVAEETGLQVAAERVAFVLETTSPDTVQHLVDIVFMGAERDRHAEPVQIEARLAPEFVLLDDLDQLDLRPPIAASIRGLASTRGSGADPHRSTAVYLGNVWQPTDTTAFGNVR